VIPSTGVIASGRALVYRVASSTLRTARSTAYRWQRSLERRGFTTPSVIKGAARRLF
jgi:transposase